MSSLFRSHALQIAAAAAVLFCLALAPAPDIQSSEIIQGDADCSGSVSSADAMAILADAGDLADAPCGFAANVNCTGGISAADALLVIRYIAGSPAPPGACAAIGDALGGVTSSIDTGLEPNQDTIPGLGGGPPRDIASSMGPDGVQVDFVANEIVIKPESEQALQEFLEKYGGTVIRDGTMTGATGISGAPDPVSERYHLVQIDPSKSSTGDLIENFEDAGLNGNFSFSDADGQAVAAIVAREEGTTVNIVLQPQVWNEHPTAVNAQGTPTAWLDAETLPYMMDSSTLSVGVDRAWDYMKYHLLPPLNGFFEPTRVGIVDTGFALDTTTGKPTDGNLDYLYFGAKPVQYDESGDDGTAGGEALASCGGGSCPWHGQGSFGVCCARPHNNYGIAGTGGETVLPILVNVDSSMYTMGDGIRRAYMMGAQVITMSMSGDCGFWCDLSTIDGNMEDYVEDATDGGAVVLAAAGNSGKDISDNEILPCKTSRVICVGGVNFDGTNAYNYGSGVDMWAPYNVWSTTTPATLAGDPNKIGLGALYAFSGTSAATPFLAGIVGMMKAANPALQYDDILTILQDTANPGGDSKVSKGYVDALRAVMASRDNAAPTIDITLPFASSTRSYHDAIFRAIVTDPDPGSGLDLFAGETTVEFYGDTGFICQTNTIKYYGTQPTYECIADVIPGTKSVEARVTDPFGATAKDEIPVTFTSGPPEITILKPASGSLWYSTQFIRFEGTVTDPDEGPFPAGQIVWTSSIDGQLQTGYSFETFLSQGTHTITAKATDSLGLIDEASITVNVQSGAGVPFVQITSPTHGQSVGWGAFSPQLTGFANDTEDGVLSGASLVWTSSIDGFLGTGTSINPTLTGPSGCGGSIYHILTLTATDSDLHAVSHQITVSMDFIC